MTDAQAVCERWGYNLASINSQAKLDYIAAILPVNIEYFIGLHYTDGEWVNTDSSSFDIDSVEFAPEMFDASLATESDLHCTVISTTEADDRYSKPEGKFLMTTNCDSVKGFICMRSIA
jgi:hypothetical protein